MVMKKRWFAIAVIILFFAAMLYFIKPRTFIDILTNSRKEFLILALLLQINTLMLRTFRWKTLLGKVKFKELFPVELIGLSAAAFSPARSGDVFKAYLLKKRLNIPISKGMSTILWEEVLNLVGYFFVSIWAIIFLPMNFKFFFFMATILMSVLFAYFISMFYSKKSFDFLSKILRKFKFIKPEHIRTFIKTGKLKKRVLISAVLISILIIINDATTFYMILKSVGVDAEYFYVIPAFCVAVFIGSFIAFLPSGVGSIDGILIALLSFAPIKLVMSATLLERIVTMWLTGALAVIVYFLTEK